MSAVVLSAVPADAKREEKPATKEKQAVIVEEPAAKPSRILEETITPPPTANDEDDDSPYLLADKDVPPCPECRKAMTPGAVVCTGCGFDTRKRKKAKRSYEPLAGSWETGLTLQQRLVWLAAAQGVHWTLGLFLVSAAAAPCRSSSPGRC